MKTHKVSELEGALLDVAVAKADGGGLDPHRPAKEMQLLLADGRRVLAGPQGAETKQHEWSPCTHWEHGGPIVEREKIGLHREPDGRWLAGDLYAWMDHGGPVIETHGHTGPTPLIAAMRAYVASKFGETVELP